MPNSTNPKQNLPAWVKETLESRQITDEEVFGSIKDNTNYTASQERLKRIWELHGEKREIKINRFD